VRGTAHPPRTFFLAASLFALGCATERPAGYDQPIDDVAPSGFWDGSIGDLGPLPEVGLGPRGVASYPAYDLSFTLPYNAPEQTFTLEIEPRQANRLDVHFSIDTTGSFGGEIASLKANLNGVVFPGLRSRVRDLALGVSRFADLPVGPYGNPRDEMYTLLSPITTDFSRVSRGVYALDQPLQNGGDPPEAWIEATYQIASGQGWRSPQPSIPSIPAFTPMGTTVGGGTEGGVGFRQGAARVLVTVTDAPSHDTTDYGAVVSGLHSMDQAVAALRNVNAKFIGIASGDPARPQLQYLAIATGAVIPPVNNGCPTGLRGSRRAPVGTVCPLVFDIAPDGSGLADTIVDGIARFLDSLVWRTVTSAVGADPQGFVTSVEAASATVTGTTTPPRREDRQPAGRLDGVLDTFTEVNSQTRLTFRVHLRNTRTPSDEVPQVYFVRVQFLGDNVVIAERVLRIIVPEGPKPDSGPDVAIRREASVVTDTPDVGAPTDILAPDINVPDLPAPDVTPPDGSPLTGDASDDASDDAPVAPPLDGGVS
jgi:hypothetical protein